MAFGIQTTVEVQKGVIDNTDRFVSVNNVGAVTVEGSLSGPIGRNLTLSVQPENINGYQFVKWIIETIPVTTVEVATSRPRNTIELMCSTTGEGGNNTDVSEGYFTDGQFLYEDRDKNKKASNGYYGVGSNSYYNHNTSTGLTGPFVCGQAGQIGGGGDAPSQPNENQIDDDEFDQLGETGRQGSPLGTTNTI